MFDELRRNILVLIFKNKGDIESYTNYRGIKVMSHIIKFWEKVIEYRLRKLITISKNLFDFMHVRSIMDVIFLIWQFIKRYWEQKMDLYMIFIHLEKAYDKIFKNITWLALEKKIAPTNWFTLIKDMYTNAMTSVITCDIESNVIF
jgi:Reverse transcriptase (RNA-dependent DNA polymerase)